MPRTAMRRKNRDRENLGVPIYYGEADLDGILGVYLVRLDLVNGKSVDMANVDEIHDPESGLIVYRGNPWNDEEDWVDDSVQITQPVDDVVRIVIY